MKKDIRLQGALFILLMIVFSISSAQNSVSMYDRFDWNEPYFDFQETYRDSLVQFQERVFLHIANERLYNDNFVFFKGYLLTGVQQNRYSFSGVLNVELLSRNGAVIKRQFHKVVDGMVEGHMELPKDISPGKYYLKAYTRWMRNYGEDYYAQKRILVGESLSKLDETGSSSGFLIVPEGGSILNGHENRLVIKAPLYQATRTGIVGRILDDKNNEVAVVSNYSACMGTAIYKPIKDREYRLELENGDKHPMPKALNQGYLLHVNNLDATTVKIRVTASSKVVETAVKLVGTLDGIKHFENELDFEDGKIEDVILSKVDIPNGILELKLVNEEGTELAKRPIWIDGERLHIDISPIQSNTGESAYKIKVTDKTNSPVKTQVAISVNKYESEYKNTIGDNSIGCSYLFPFPEIATENNNPSDRKRRFLMDLSVLLSEIELNNNSPNEIHLESDIKYPIQRGLELTGYAYGLDNKLLSNTQIQIIALNEDTMWFEETETDADGLLKLDEMQLNGNTTLVFRTKGKDVKSRLVKVKLAKDWEQKEVKSIAGSTKKEERIRTVRTTSQQLIDTTGIIELEEVEVSERRMEERKSMPSVHGIDIPNHRIKYQDPKKPRSIAQMLSEIPGVVVSGIGDLIPSVRIVRATGGGPILFVLDGMPLPQGDSGQEQNFGSAIESSLGPIMNLVSDNDVERIELMIGADASIYGSRGSGGVILVYTRSGKELEFIRRKEGQLVLQGYEPILEFKSHQHGLSKRVREKSVILYWNPKLVTNENGEANIRFPASSQETEIKIEVSIITPDGKIGSLSTNF